MKMTKRIFIALLIVSILVSVFAFSALAEENTSQDYARLLEYFEESTMFDYDFTGEDVNYSSDLLVQNPTEVEHKLCSETEEGALIGKYLSISVKERSGWKMYDDNHVYFGWTSDAPVDDFNIDMTVSGASNNTEDGVSEEGLPKIIIAVGSDKLESLDNANTAGVTIAALNFRKGCFSYLKAVTAEDGTVYGSEVDTSFALLADTWYDVSVTYDVEKGAVTITVTDCSDPTNTVTVEDGYVPYASVKDVRIGAHGYDSGSARGTEMRFADVRLLGGVYHRDPSNMVADIEAQILEMYEWFLDDENPIEDKIIVCDIVKAIKEYGFTSDNLEVQKAIDELGIGAVGLYNFKIETCVSTVDTLSTFAEKRALVDESLDFAELLEEIDLTGVDAELVTSVEVNLAALEVVDAYLKTVEDNSLAFIAAVDAAKGIDINDYPAVSAHIAGISVYEPDLTYEGADEANKYYVKLCESAEAIKTLGDKFVELVNTAYDTDLEFPVRVDAYRAIEDAYFDNETYSGVTEALAIYHNELVPYMSVEISNAESFIKYVNKADYSVYVSAKQENLDIAKEYIDICQPTYKGVAEAKELYETVQTYINEQIANASAYIAAVEALDSLSGSKLTEGIKNAYSLQEEGNVLGVEGVTEANIKLNQLVASIELKEEYRAHFIRLVDSIDDATDSEELFEILVSAKEAEADADDSFYDVREASKKLAAAIEDYNKRVSEINGEFAKANEVASRTSGVGKTANTVADRVIAFIVKFFDED